MASPTMHPMCTAILTSFGYEETFQHLTLYKNTPFKIKNLKFWRRGALPPPQRDRGGTFSSATYSTPALI